MQQNRCREAIARSVLRFNSRGGWSANNRLMIAADVELNMPGSLVAVGTQEFASTFLDELIRNVSDWLPSDDALTPDDEAFDCSIDRVVRHGDRVIVTVAFEFDEPQTDASGATFDVVLDIDEQRAYVPDEAAGL